jgi:hypothetical protein
MCVFYPQMSQIIADFSAILPQRGKVADVFLIGKDYRRVCNSLQGTPHSTSGA